MSYLIFLFLFKNTLTSIFTTSPINPSRDRFFLIDSTEVLLLSTKVALSAPLLKASSPREPVPANRSRTFNPETPSSNILFKTENIASLTRFVAGLTPISGTYNFLPEKLPPVNFKNLFNFSP